MPPRSSASDPQAIRIRRARRSDLPALIDLENRAFSSDRMSTRQLRHHLGNPGAEILVAARSREVVGVAVLFLHPRHRAARLYSIAVSAHARGAGIGEALLAAAERAARAHGKTLIRLEVRADNAAAQRLYEQRGYRRFGSRPVYYEDGHDALRYEKVLTRARAAGR
ncbi:MAG TPA: ribosomal protein S18-alanine N-acetyltransferase [Rhodanobacteraceae bacterium]